MVDSKNEELYFQTGVLIACQVGNAEWLLAFENKNYTSVLAGDGVLDWSLEPP